MPTDDTAREDTGGTDEIAEVTDAKQAWRERTWAAMQEARVARFPGARGRIPNFTGAEKAAALLSGTDAWARAEALKANPDLPQLPVRAAALEAGKLVVMAVPRLRAAAPFLLLDPDVLEVVPRKAASIGGADEHGRPLAVDAVPHLDLVVCGSVCVNPEGVRIGKGGGYSDLEMALGIEIGWIDERTVIATTVHPLQVVDGELPETDHDFRVDLIVTPDEVVRCPGARRPPGILWDHLDDEKIASVPALAARRS
ncbi:MAG TPA: 5-formyltetrahydrofolate cyclo-ligase [Acidimicrobiales bacterium]